MTSELYYKIVNTEDGVLKSCIIPKYSGGIVYRVGEWTKPVIANSKLFVFNSLESAKNFRGGNWFQSIYECEVINPTLPPSVIVHHMSFYRYTVEKFWDGHALNLDEQSDYIINGTVFCDSVKLTKLIP